MKIGIKKKPYLHALRLSKKVHNNKLATGRRNVEHKNLQSDLYNFVIQSILSDYFDSTMPTFGERYNLIINDKSLDVKKVNYDNLSQRTIGRVNKNQHEANLKTKDGYIFTSIDGDFKHSLFSGYEIYIPIPEQSSVLIWGWSSLDNIKNISETYTKTNRFGKELDSFYSINLHKLKSISTI